MQVVFRADASHTLGGGHVRRCLTLADALVEQGAEVRFITNAEAIQLVPDLARYPVFSENAPFFEADLLVVDHYGLDASYESSWRPYVRHIMVIDDLASRQHDCDLLLDQTYGRNESDYRHHIPAHCKMLLGANYALLRPQFALARETALLRRTQLKGKIERIAVTFGTVDQYGLCMLVMQALAGLQTPIQVDMICEPQHPQLQTMKQMAISLPHAVNFYHQVVDMAGFMEQADLAIGAAGTTSWERCALGLPALVYQVADNQRKILEELAQAGAIWDMGNARHATIDGLVKQLNILQETPAHLITASMQAAAICDGMGASRVARVLFEKGANYAAADAN